MVMAGNDALLEAMKEELVAANNELEAAKEEISRKNNELESVKKQLQESEARNIQAEQQSGIVVELMQPRGVIIYSSCPQIIHNFFMALTNHIMFSTYFNSSYLAM